MKWLKYRVPVFANVYYTDVTGFDGFNGFVTNKPEVHLDKDLAPYGIDFFGTYIYENMWNQPIYICLTNEECTYYGNQCLRAFNVIEEHYLDDNRDIVSYFLHNITYHFKDSANNWVAWPHHSLRVKHGIRHYSGGGAHL